MGTPSASRAGRMRRALRAAMLRLTPSEEAPALPPRAAQGPSPWPRRVRRVLRWTFRPLRLAFVLALLSAVILAHLLSVLIRIPVDGGMRPDTVAASMVLEARDGEGFATRGALRGEPIAANALPPTLRDAVVAIEDRRFYEHGGLDLRGITRALLRYATGTGREGASTITQQLARLEHLSQDRSVTRKLQEAMIAVWLEARLSKDEILARYLNQAYFGAGAWGADAAARRYFGKGAADLTVAEAAMLAGLVRAPSALAPNRNPDGARQRASLVLGVMQDTGRATPEAVAAARAAPPTLRAPPEMVPGRGWFADWAEAEARRLLGPLPVDVQVRTTLDPALQDIAERSVAAIMDREGGRANAGQAALVAMTHDGAVLAVVGGRDYFASQFNRVTQARRQPGSLFKLFTYAATLEGAATPDSIVMDRPVRIGDWEPNNSNGRFAGQMTVRQAFAQSVNTVAVQLYQSAGRDRVLGVARRLGLRSEMPDVPSIALGAGETTLIEMTAAYAAIAANRAVEPHVIRGVRARDRSLYTRPDTMGGNPVLSSAAQSGMMDLLLSAVRDGTGRAARLDRPVAGKTGTTQDNRDAWFVGMTADVVVGVWIGNDDNTPMRNVVGGDLPARIWRDFVAAADRARTADAPIPQVVAAPIPAAAPRQPPVRGVPAVLDTGTLRFGSRAIQLTGVIGMRGDFSRQMSEYLAGREVVCELAGDAAHRCTVEGRDLSEVVLFNGGGRAAADAAPGYRDSEAAARAAGRGVWSGR